MKVECSVCEAEVEESTTFYSEDGLVCSACRPGPESSDVEKLWTKDKRLAAYLVSLGMALLAVAGYLTKVRADEAEALLAQGATFEDATYGAGVVLTVFVAGFAALAVGTAKIWRPR
ncbi:MAG: hypothetical protein AUK47_26260 [Deltaproteobacteria bacterium CG2_30_63_29]|nr:MAG: hypothetical protein AUK47_26260 [Deltaproteobacteria bacterium CG2_30_63_29]PJB49179.1 MAG: hypothetical protein CO108_00665 [Deltaproteobacteria bacterium CG_4_9_14_3_um_filter_63_12]